MTNKSYQGTIPASLLGLTFLTVSSVTYAGEYELWREKEQTTPSERTTLAAVVRQGTTPNYRLWREQVQHASQVILEDLALRN